MHRLRIFLVVSAVAGAALLVPSRAAPQPAERAQTTRRAEDEFARLRAELDRVNAEIADLKRGNRSMRNDYRLRDRMADAEALAQKLTQAEKRLRTLGVAKSPGEGSAAPTATPQALPQDGSVELEAKADLLADRAGRLVKEADALANVAGQLRSRTALRRRAGAWDRDPFTSLEASRRNLAISTQTPTSEATRASPGAASDSSGKGPVFGSAPIEAPPAKLSPQPAAMSADRPLDQRIFLDPTTAAEVRQVLGTGATLSDPDALDRAAAALRARARALAAQAQALRAKSRAP